MFFFDVQPTFSISEVGSEIRIGSFAERLRALIGETSRNRFARKCGISESSLRKYLAGGTPGLDKVLQIASACGVSLLWLAAGEGPMRPENGSNVALRSRDLVRDGYTLVPLLDVQAAAGAGAVVEQETVSAEVAFTAKWLRDRHINPSGARMLTAKGDSMEPTFRSGDTLIVDTSIDVVVDSSIYVVIFGGLLLVKRVQLRLDGGVVLMSDNKTAGYADEVIPAAQVPELRIAGRVMWYGREI